MYVGSVLRCAWLMVLRCRGEGQQGSCAMWELLKCWNQDSNCLVLQAVPPKMLPGDIFSQQKFTESSGCSDFALSWSDMSPVSRDGEKVAESQNGEIST